LNLAAMKILVLTPTFFPIMGGAELGIFEIYRRLAKRHEVIVLTPWPAEALARVYAMEEPDWDMTGFRILRFKDKTNFKQWPFPEVFWGAIPPFSFSFIGETRRAIERHRPDRINAFYALPTGLAAIAAQKRKNVPVVLSLIGRDIPGPHIPPLWGKYVRFVSHSLADNIFISKYCRDALLGPDSEEGKIVPFGVDLEKFKPENDGRHIKELLRIPKGARVLFSLQRLDPWKRVSILIEAMKLIIKKIDAYLVIGGKGAQKMQLMSLARDRGLQSRIIFAGYIREADLPSYYAMSDLFVFHSTYETFGLALLQAMASGRPVVSVRSTAIPELIEDHRTGLLVEPSNPDELARAAIDLLEDEPAMISFSTEARRKAVEKYSWQSIADQYERILECCRT